MTQDRDIEAMLRRLYDAYNRRDADSLVASLAPDVDWPDEEKGLHGHAAVRAYWAEQWRRIRTHDTVTGVVGKGDEWMVGIESVVSDLHGGLLSAGRRRHRFHLRDGLVVRMDITKL